jgi:glycosyltransferase involved in cell wall biosynthesis
MKILVICQYYYPEPFRITDICESLVERGHFVTVLTGLPNYPEGKILEGYRKGKKRKEVINGVNIIRCFEVGRANSKLMLFVNYFSYAVSASVRTFFMKEKFDVVFVNQLSPVMMGIPAMVYKKKHKRIKILLYCLDLWPDSLAAGGIKQKSIIYKIFLGLSKRIYNSADSILVTSSMFKRYFKDTLGITKEKVSHLPQYAEEDLFSKVAQDSNKENYNFVFAGNIGDMQSVETIVKAANELRTYRNIVFHIVGDGSKLEEIKLLSKSLGLNKIIFYGRQPVNEMPYYFSLADAMLVTLKDNKTLSYTLPGKVQSYMAASKPIIGAINGETRHVIEKSGCGFCCEAENYKDLAKLIIDFCESESKEEMGVNSYNFYQENYNKEKFISVLENKLVNLEA